MDTTDTKNTWAAFLGVLCAFGVLCGDRVAGQQEPASPQAVSPGQLQAAVDKLGDLNYDTRTRASQTIRRTPNTQAVLVLLRAVQEHADGYVRYRALVLLTGFNDPRIRDAMIESLSSPNDRLRTVAYSYFEHNPDHSMVSTLLVALDKENAEFVRPALVRALAAIGDDPRVQTVLIREAGRGEDFFRSAVIEALGDYKATYAQAALAGIAKLDGPLQDDAVVAIGKLGDREGLETLSSLQSTASPTTLPFIAAGICLVGTSCETHERYVIDTLKFGQANNGYQTLVRASAASLGVLAVAGRKSAAEALIDAGVAAKDPARAPIAIAVATLALRNTPLLMSLLESHIARREAITLLAEGFDMLEEDLEKERFFALVRRTFWGAPAGSPTRDLMQTLIGTLEF